MLHAFSLNDTDMLTVKLQWQTDKWQSQRFHKRNSGC